jgi:hypothetical protein
MMVVYCVGTTIVVLLVLFVMFLSARDVNITNRGLFNDWRDALLAYREAQSIGARLFLLLLQLAYLFRTGMWGFLAAAAAAMGAALAALCGLDWADFAREIRLALRDFYDYLRSRSAAKQEQLSLGFIRLYDQLAGLRCCASAWVLERTHTPEVVECNLATVGVRVAL